MYELIFGEYFVILSVRVLREGDVDYIFIVRCSIRDGLVVAGRDYNVKS